MIAIHVWPKMASEKAHFLALFVQRCLYCLFMRLKMLRITFCKQNQTSLSLSTHHLAQKWSNTFCLWRSTWLSQNLCHLFTFSVRNSKWRRETLKIGIDLCLLTITLQFIAIAIPFKRIDVNNWYQTLFQVSSLSLLI